MLKSILISLAMFVMYVLAINYVAAVADQINITNNDNQIALKTQYGLIQKAGVGDSVTVEVKRRRWYGLIHELPSVDDRTADLYLFYFIKLPLMHGGINFTYLHPIALLAILFTGVIILTLSPKKNKFINPNDS